MKYFSNVLLIVRVCWVQNSIFLFNPHPFITIVSGRSHIIHISNWNLSITCQRKHLLVNYLGDIILDCNFTFLPKQLHATMKLLHPLFSTKSKGSSSITIILASSSHFLFLCWFQQIKFLRELSPTCIPIAILCFLSTCFFLACILFPNPNRSTTSKMWSLTHSSQAICVSCTYGRCVDCGDVPGKGQIK